MGRVERKRFS